MIVHVSMPADDCEKVARVLAAMMLGRPLRFPPGGPTAWNVWSADGSTQIVVTPRGQFLVPGATEVAWAERPRAPASETHFALCVDRPAAEIVNLAAQAGWPARVCDRGGFFSVVELWVEGAYLVELLDPAFAEQYRRSMTIERWEAQFGASERAPSPAA
jgi:hypothetical protein